MPRHCRGENAVLICESYSPSDMSASRTAEASTRLGGPEGGAGSTAGARRGGTASRRWYSHECGDPAPWAGPATMAELPTDCTESRLATVPHRGLPCNWIPADKTHSQSRRVLKVTQTAPFCRNWTVDRALWSKDCRSSGRTADEPTKL